MQYSNDTPVSRLKGCGLLSTRDMGMAVCERCKEQPKANYLSHFCADCWFAIQVLWRLGHTETGTIR